MFVFVCVCVCVCVCVFVWCMFVCVCVWPGGSVWVGTITTSSHIMHVCVSYIRRYVHAQGFI